MSHSFVMLTVLLGAFALPAPALARCDAARAADATRSLPDVWRGALDALVRSTLEPGHPWSCSAGTLELELEPNGAVLAATVEGGDAVRRHVASPEEVVPLGQALLALPLVAAAPADAETHAGAAPEAPPVAASEPARALPRSPQEASQQAAPTAPSEPSRRLLLSVGVDARGVGRSAVAWLGPTVNAALRMGRWLPLISFRQQSALFTDGPSIDELSIALAVQSRFEISAYELRLGPALRGSVVQRDFSRKRGDQNRVEGRIALIASFVLPVFSWGSVVLSADADVVVLSRETAQPASSSGDQAPKGFPTYTIGGSACFEVQL